MAAASTASTCKQGAAAPSHPDGDAALAALADEHLVREQLDRAQIVVAKTERRHGKSWSQITIRLHM